MDENTLEFKILMALERLMYQNIPCDLDGDYLQGLHAGLYTATCAVRNVIKQEKKNVQENNG